MSAGASATGASTTCCAREVPRGEPQTRIAALPPEQPGGAQAAQGQASQESNGCRCSSQAVNEVWSLDFVMDSLANGRRIKCLTVVDDFSRECVDIAVDYGHRRRSMSRGCSTKRGQFRGYPEAVRTDQGPEFTSRAFMAWAHSRRVRHLIKTRAVPCRTPTSRASTASSVTSA